MSDLDDVDLTDPDLLRYGDPHGTYRMLRERAPVFWHEKPAYGTSGQGFWAVTGYAEASEVHRRADVFTHGDTVFMDLLPADIPKQLSMTDPPEHTQFRRQLSRHFTAKAIERSSEDVREVIRAVLDGVAAETGVFNFHERIAEQIPFLATSRLFEIPVESARRLAEQLQQLQYGRSAPLKAFTEEVIAFFDDHTSGWAPDENDGIVCAVLNAEVDGARMDRYEALANLWILFTGALDTTSHAFTSGLLSLFHHPDQLERLRNDVSLVPSAVTELLRWTSTSNVVKHRATRDTRLGESDVREGDYVATYPPSANRDEQVFADPFTFDVGRGRESPIFTFGAGPHLCPGHNFARLELKIIFEELLTRFPNIEQAGAAVRGEAFTMTLSPLVDLPVRLGKHT